MSSSDEEQTKPLRDGTSVASSDEESVASSKDAESARRWCAPFAAKRLLKIYPVSVVRVTTREGEKTVFIQHCSF